MAKVRKSNNSKKKPIEQYDHKGKKRVNNPPVGLVTPETDKETGKKTYAYDPHLDPQLVWAGKAERTSFEVPTVSLHVHERIDPRTIVEAVRKRNGQADNQMSLFQSPGRESSAPRSHRVLQASAQLVEPPDRRRFSAGDEFPSGKRRHGRSGPDDLHRPALRHPLRLELSAICEQARCERRQGRGPHSRAGNDPRPFEIHGK